MVEKANTEDELNNLKQSYDLLQNKCNFLQNYCNKVEVEKIQFQCYCAQLQLKLQMIMLQMNYQQNLNNFNNFQMQANLYKNQLNQLINKNNNNLGNSLHNNITNNQKIISLIFCLDNKKKYPVVTLPESRLGNVFLLLLDQIDNPNEYNNIYKLRFFYNAMNITQHFINNDEVRILNLNSVNPVIEINKTF